MSVRRSRAAVLATLAEVGEGGRCTQGTPQERPLAPEQSMNTTENAFRIARDGATASKIIGQNGV